MDMPKSLSDFGGPSRPSGDQVCFMICPVCGSRKWKVYVNPLTGLWWCHAPEHGGGGAVDVGSPLTGQGRAILDLLEGQPAVVENVWPEVSLPAWTELSWRARRYLRRRGIDDDTATRLGIVEMADRMRVVVPYFGPSGGIIYWTARSYSDLEEGPKYLAASGKHPLYVLPNWHPQPDAIVVEGVFDAISISQATGKMAIALGGKACPRYLRGDVLALVRDSITVCLDADAFADALKLRNSLATKRNVSLALLPPGEDPSSMGEAIKEVLP